MNKDHFLWVERYRPKTISECILPNKIKQELQEQINLGEIQHLLFHGIQGSGKTSAAFAISRELNADTMVINASDERGIDLFRMKVKQFVSSVSFERKSKIVLLEEADNLMPDSQKILRRILEEFSNNSKFILTCNYPAKIIPAIHSRMASYSFNITAEDQKSLCNQFFMRVQTILTENKIKCDKKILAEFIMKYFPDYRKILNELQKYSLNGEIDAGIFSTGSNNVDVFVKYIIEKDFKKARQHIGENALDSDFYANVYKSIMESKEFPKNAIASSILIIADYQYKHAFAVDSDLNIAAMSIELMSNL